MTSSSRLEQIGDFLKARNWSYQLDTQHQQVVFGVDEMTVIVNVLQNEELIRFRLPKLFALHADDRYYKVALETLQQLSSQYKLVQWQCHPKDREVQLQVDWQPFEDEPFTLKKFWDNLQFTVEIAQQGYAQLQNVLKPGQPGETPSPATTSQATRILLQTLLQAEAEGGAEAVYKVLDERNGRVDPQLPAAAKAWLEQISAEQGQELQYSVKVALIENFACSLQEYPRGRQGENITLAISLYELVLEARPRHSVPEKHAQTLNNLGIAYSNQADLGQDPAANLQQAIRAYREAEEIFGRLGLEKDLATTLTNLGNAYSNQADLGQDPAANLQEAIRAYREAEQIRRRLELEKDLATTLTNLGLAYQIQAQLGQDPAANLQQAIRAYREAEQIRRRPGLEKDLAQTLTNLGIAYQIQAQLGQDPAANLQQAIRAYREAEEIFRRLELEKDLATTLNNLGVAYSNQADLGQDPAANLQQAIRAYREAEQIRRRLGLEKDVALTLTNLGAAYSNQAELGQDPAANLQEAIRAYREAEQIRRRLGLEKDLASTLNNLGLAYSDQAELGQDPAANLQQAIRAYREAEQIRRRLGLEKDLASTLNNLGLAYSDQAELGQDPAANLQQAIRAYREAEEIDRRLGLEKDVAQTLNNLGAAYYTQAELGQDPAANLQQAIRAYREAEEIRRRPGLEKDLASTLNNLGIAYGNQADKVGENVAENRRQAANCYREALQFFRPQILPVECLKAARALGNLGFRQGDWHLALEGYRDAMEAIEYSRTQRLSNAERQEVVAKSIYVYENAIQAAINRQEITTALEIAERVRAKRLKDLMATADLYQDGNIPEEVRQWLQQLDQLDDQIAIQRQQMDDKDNDGSDNKLKTRQLRAAKETSDQILQLEREKQAILDKINSRDEVIAKLRQVQPPQLQEFLPLLQDSPHAALLSFYTTKNDTHIFILRAGETTPDCFTCSGQGYQKLQQWLRESWVNLYNNNKSQWIQQMPDILAELSQRLDLDRLIAEQLADVDELILIPHLFLHQIPFAALPLSGENAYLGDKFCLRYAPSLQVLGFCHRRGSVSQRHYATVENATNDLPFSGFEGSNVTRLFQIPPEQHLVGEEATRDAYRRLLAEQGTTHLVSSHHAQSRFDNPEESGLKLSDGKIAVTQLFSPGWRFPQLEEVYLSCCETGLFTPKGAVDEPVAVSTGFLCAGARGVIASHWSIYDLSAALLSVLYHEQRHQGKNRSLALQAAQQKMRQMTGAEFEKTYGEPIREHLEAEEDRIADVDWQASAVIGDEIDGITLYAQEKYPFEHPVHWASLGCYGLS
jgi:CHAT domain-containing protein